MTIAREPVEQVDAWVREAQERAPLQPEGA